jgi:hypothetical protein
MFSAVAAAVQLIFDVEDRMSKQIKLKIFPDGQVQAEVLGFRGKKCTDYISILEQLLDAEAIDSERTPEYYLEESVVIHSPQVQTIGRG